MTKRDRFRIAGLCGIIEPLVVSLFVLLAVFISPWFSWTDNALSDLGVQGSAAVVFNTGLVLGGVLTGVFATGLGKALNSSLGRVGKFIVILDAAALSAIGIFPETAGELHLYVSVAFFVLLSLYLLIFGVGFIFTHERKWGLITVILGLFSAFVWIFGWEGVAIPETLAYLAASAWSVTMGFRLFKQS